MNIKTIICKLVIFILYIAIFLGMTLFAGVNNTLDDEFTEFEFKELKNEVRVYRDEFGVPSIIGENLRDILFVQGFEFARDRSWQLEFYRSLINGELSRLFGPDLVETDIFLRTVGLKRAAENMVSKISADHLALISSYVDGVNKYYETHKNNPPLELEILRKSIKPWEITDTIAMASIVAFTFAFGGLFSEVIRMKTLQKLGPVKTEQLFPIDFPPAKDFMINLNQSMILPSSDQKIRLNSIKSNINIFSEDILQGFQSNNWVVSGKKTASGYAILSNDPHTNLEAQGIWNRVNLYTSDGSVYLQGFAFPGMPLLAFGHNQYLAWGVTAGMLDTVDLFYLKENGTHYLVNNTTWKRFKTISTTIEVSGANDIEKQIRISDFGPIVDTDLGEFALMWTLNQNYSRDNPIASLVEFNFAKNADEFHNALRTMLTGFNWVYATVNDHIGYQNTGIIPIRKNGYGLIPMNGSNGENGWLDPIPYDQQLSVRDPSEGYFATANERVDTRELFYISESYAHRYRNDRIEQVLENATDFDADPDNLRIDDMQKLQQDVKNLVAEDLLTPVLPLLTSSQFEGPKSELISQVITDLANWDFRMDIDSVSALVFVTYRLFLVDNVVRDEMGELADIYSYTGIRTIGSWLKNPENITWFDNIYTANIETWEDIVKQSMADTVEYLSNRYGEKLDNWNWGDKHRVILPHTFSSAFPTFDIGGKQAAGSSLTVNAISGPLWNEGEIIYTSSYGPYFRWVMEVNNKWDSIWGMNSAGTSQNPYSPHYSDAYNGWIEYKYTNWANNATSVPTQLELTAVFRSE